MLDVCLAYACVLLLCVLLLCVLLFCVLLLCVLLLCVLHLSVRRYVVVLDALRPLEHRKHGVFRLLNKQQRTPWKKKEKRHARFEGEV